MQGYKERELLQLLPVRIIQNMHFIFYIDIAPGISFSLSCALGY